MKPADLVWVPNQATGKTLKEYGYNGSYEMMPDGTSMQIPDQCPVKSRSLPEHQPDSMKGQYGREGESCSSAAANP